MIVRGPELYGPEQFPFAPQLLLGDLFFAFRGDSQQLQVDAVRAGEAAGKTLGSRIKSQLSAANIGTVIGAALGGATIAALKMTQQYDDAIDSIRVGTGATGEALKGLQDDFKAVAARVPDDLGTIGQTIADLNTRTGQTGEGLQKLAEQILDLSRITKTDASANVAALTRLYGDWSIATENQAEANDKLFRASQATGIGVTQLAETVVSFGAPLRALGLTFEESISILGKWEKEGVNIETILAGMRMAVANFAKAGIDPREGLPALIAQIEGADDATGLLAAKQIVGQRAANDFFRAVREGRFDVAELMDVVENGSDTINQATKETEGLSEMWRQFKNVVATTVGPVLTGLGDIATEMGNLVFLLPAMTGAIGRGLGKLVSSSLVRTAAARAGAAIGAILHGAMFAVNAMGSALSNALGGSAIVGRLSAVGRTWGRAIGLAAAGAMAGIIALQLDELMKAEEKVIAARQTIRSGAERRAGGEFDTSELQAQLKSLQEYRRSLDSGGEGLGAQLVFAFDIGKTKSELDRQMEEIRATIRQQHWRAAQEARLDGERIGQNLGEGITDGTTTTIAAQTQSVGTSIGEAFRQVAAEPVKRITALVSTMIPKWRELDASIIALAVGGLGRLKKESQSADEQWKKLIQTGDRNRQSIEKLNEEIGKWERRYNRAIRNNDSEAAAFAAAQLTRLTDERQSRQQVVNKVQAQHDALKALPKNTTTRINVIGEGALDRVITKVRGLTSGEAVVRIGAQVFGGIGGRASGGPVKANVPYWVGEMGRRELFIPKDDGTIVTEHRAMGGAGGTTFNIDNHGMPMKARTPRELVQELRRASRLGVFGSGSPSWESA